MDQQFQHSMLPQPTHDELARLKLCAKSDYAHFQEYLSWE